MPARTGQLLDGFREYCILRLDAADNRVWPTLLRRLRLGDNLTAPLTAAQDQDLVELHLRRPG